MYLCSYLKGLPINGFRVQNLNGLFTNGGLLSIGGFSFMREFTRIQFGHISNSRALGESLFFHISHRNNLSSPVMFFIILFFISFFAPISCASILDCFHFAGNGGGRNRHRSAVVAVQAVPRAPRSSAPRGAGLAWALVYWRTTEDGRAGGRGAGADQATEETGVCGEGGGYSAIPDLARVAACCDVWQTTAHMKHDRGVAPIMYGLFLRGRSVQCPEGLSEDDVYPTAMSKKGFVAGDIVSAGQAMSLCVYPQQEWRFG